MSTMSQFQTPSGTFAPTTPQQLQDRVALTIKAQSPQTCTSLRPDCARTLLPGTSPHLRSSRRRTASSASPRPSATSRHHGQSGEPRLRRHTTSWTTGGDLRSSLTSTTALSPSTTTTAPRSVSELRCQTHQQKCQSPLEMRVRPEHQQ